MSNYLHNHKEFNTLLRIVGAELNIEPGLIEKDYWIMHVLYGLKQQGYQFELKGGTSLSKGYGIIHRFSEDIDVSIEKDFLGEKQLPDTAYYGVQTLRGKENFHITGIPMSTEPYFVKAFGYVKKAAALANRDLGVLDAPIANAIAAACDRLIAGEMADQFVTDFIQFGLGALANCIHIHAFEALVDGDKLGSETETYDGDIDV